MKVEAIFPVFRLLTPVLSVLISFSVGCFVIAKNRERPVNRVIAGIAFASSHYNLFQALFFFYPSVWMVRIGWIGAVALIPLLAEFPDAVIDNRYALPRTRNWARGIGAFFLCCLPTELMFLERLEPMGTVFLALGGPIMKFYAGTMGFFLARIGFRLVKALRGSPEENQKRRLEFVLLGAVFYCLCALHDMLLRHQIFWIFEFPIVEWATLAFMIIVVYATMRFRLIDVDVFLGMGVYYTCLTLGTAVVYKSAEYFLETYLQHFVNLGSWWAQMLPAFMVALFFEPVRWVVRMLIDSLFLAGRYRKMKIFNSPNFQYLVLDSRWSELESLRDEINRILEEERKPPST